MFMNLIILEYIAVLFI